MESEHMNLLTTKRFYKVQSDKTGKMFIDDQCNCYLFDKKSDAEVYMSEITDISIINAEIPRPTVYCDELYTYGYKNIHVTVNSKTTDIPITSTKRPGQLSLYNPQTDGRLLRLKQTDKKKYLCSLYDAVFYSPVLISERISGRHPVIHYSYAEHTGNKYYTLFSSIREFNAWNEKMEEDWKPFAINIIRFDRIRQKNPIIINPDSLKIILSNEHVKYIAEAKKDAEKENR